MDVHQLCLSMKARISVELQESAGPREKRETLISALYELSRAVLPTLGPPRKSQDYLDQQKAVLDLITFIALPLIRGPLQERRAVTVLSEVAEGCADPQLKKKLAVYAQELLAKLNAPTAENPIFAGGSMVASVVGWFAALAVVVQLTLSLSGGTKPAATAPPPAPPAASPSPTYHASPLTPGQLASGEAGRGMADAPHPDPRTLQPAPPEIRVPGVPGEQMTKVRVANNQVLIPVILKNGGESVRAELIFDTGASRTAIHEALAGKLGIDLRTAKTSQSELADGRMITSRRAKVDAMVVGPFTLTAADVELIPYRGSDGVHDGMLGMDFLGRHRYQVDVDQEVIHWY